MEQQKINQTSSNVKQHFRHFNRKYFKSKYSFAIKEIRDVNFMLMNFEDINNLKKKLGKKGYEAVKKSLTRYANLYAYASVIYDLVMKMQEKHESDLFKKKIDMYNKELMKIASGLPVVEYWIWKANFTLVNNCDLRDHPVPKEERFDKKKFPEYLKSESMNF